MNKIQFLIIILGFIFILYVQQGISSLSVNKPDEGVFLRLDWNNNEIVNGKEFNIEIKAFDLEDKNYDLKVYIYQDDKDKPISQTRDEDFKWISSDRYVKNFFTVSGNQSDSIKLRINEKYNAFKGGATIIARIRESGTSNYIEEQEDIFIIRNKFPLKETDSDDNILQNEDLSDTNEESIITEKVIRIGTNKETESIKTQNNIVYESKNELIKRYSIYGFIGLIIIFLILLALKLI